MAEEPADPRSVAMAYLQKHKLLEIFELLGSKIAMMKPGEPNEFLIQELSKISALQARAQPITLFTEKDIQVMFGFFDITGKGTINVGQYMKALNACGVAEPALPLPDEDEIDKKTFVKYLLAEVMEKAL